MPILATDPKFPIGHRDSMTRQTASYIISLAGKSHLICPKTSENFTEGTVKSSKNLWFLSIEMGRNWFRCYVAPRSNKNLSTFLWGVLGESPRCEIYAGKERQYQQHSGDTVGGRNPAPPGMYKTV